MLGRVFDEVWASVAPEFGDDPQKIETGRFEWLNSGNCRALMQPALLHERRCR
jgi:hypothetical protein